MRAQHDNPTETRRQTIQAAIDTTKSAAERNRFGQFATPNALAIDIARYVDSLIDNRKLGVRFADPAIGSGSFFSAALAVFGPKRIKSAVGVELDPAFCEAARDLWSDTALELVNGDFTVFVANASRPPAPDLILANPPYVRHHHIDRQDKERLQRLAYKMTGVEVNGLAGLYVYFLLLATAWMEDGGYAGWLIPSEFMDVNYGAALKRFLTDRVTLIRAHRFDDATLRSCPAQRHREVAMTVRVISLVVFGCWLCSIESLPASTGDRGFLDIGIFHPVRYRLNETTVLSTHPLLFPLNPNVGLDRVFIETARSALGTRHAIDYPTPLISLLSRSGPGGIYPADVSVPQIFLIRNAVYAGRSFERIAVELELGLRFGFTYGNGKLPTLDLLYFYPRTAAIQHGLVYDAGLNLRISLSKLTVHLDQKLFLVADRQTIFHFENYSYLALALSEKVFFDCGGMYLWGTFYYGSDHIVLPYGDFRIIF